MICGSPGCSWSSSSFPLLSLLFWFFLCSSQTLLQLSLLGIHSGITPMGRWRLCSYHCKSPGTRSTPPNSSPSPPKKAVSAPALQLTGGAGALLLPGEAPRARPAPSEVYSSPSLLPFPHPWPFLLARLLSPACRLVPALDGVIWRGLEPGKGTALTPQPVPWAGPVPWCCVVSQDMGSTSLFWLFPPCCVPSWDHVDRNGNFSAARFISPVWPLPFSPCCFHLLPHLLPRAFPLFHHPSSFLVPFPIPSSPPTSWPCSERRVSAHSTGQKTALTPWSIS